MIQVINLGQDIGGDNIYLSHTLVESIKKYIKAQKKVILYLNKRGESNALICESCHHIYKCESCDCSFHVHKYPERLLCHLCNKQENIPVKCEKCGEKHLKKVGVGTQQIESSLSKLFPESNIFRFDTDTVRNTSLKKEALSKLKQADIIIGTKMITTGFDFENIGLIGIILLEQELLVPKYDTEEKVTANIKQLIGRGGRKGEKTEIMVQTFVPKNHIIETITSKNYKDFFVETLHERKKFSYPPFVEMATLEYRDKNKEKGKEFIEKLGCILKENNTQNQYQIEVLTQPIKKESFYFYKLRVKGENVRSLLQSIKKIVLSNKSLSVSFD